MKEALTQYVKPDRIIVIPLWTNNSFLRPLPKHENFFIKEHKLDNKFVVLYSGNFGFAHHTDLLLDLAFKCTNDSVMFVITGGGPAEKSIKQKMQFLGLKNCLILPWQDVNALPYSLSSADLAIVTLSENAAKLGIPSKVFNYMSVGNAVMCISGRDSELWNLVHHYKIGRAFTADQVNEMIDYINELYKNPALLRSYQANSLRASLAHTSENVDLIMRHYVY